MIIIAGYALFDLDSEWRWRCEIWE